MEKFERLTQKVGSSLMITIPNDIVKKNGIEVAKRYVFAFIGGLNDSPRKPVSGETPSGAGISGESEGNGNEEQSLYKQNRGLRRKSGFYLD